jgi:hypothetical protein
VIERRPENRRPNAPLAPSTLAGKASIAEWMYLALKPVIEGAAAIVRHIVPCLRPLEAAAQEYHPGCPMCIQSLANRLRFVAAGNCAIDCNCKAGTGVAGTCLQIGGSLSATSRAFSGRVLRPASRPS